MERFFAYIRTLIDQDTVWIPAVIISLLAFNFLIIVKRSVLRDILDILSEILSKGYHAVLSFLDNAMEAAKSASLFILSIRVMLFKQQSQRVTTHVLHSSIFFLSIASYIATFSSMKLMVNSTIALFLTFSIQATIVAIGVSIGAKQAPFGQVDWARQRALREKKKEDIILVRKKSRDGKLSIRLKQIIE